MWRFHSTRRCLLAVLALVALASAGCGVLDGSPSPTPTPTAAQSLGLEIAETRGQMMHDARDLVEPRPAAPETKEALRLLREEYKLRFGNYACLRDTLPAADQAAVAETFDANHDAFLPEMAWLEHAASDYDLEDPDIRIGLEALRTLDDYAFLDRAAESHPGDELLCGG